MDVGQLGLHKTRRHDTKNAKPTKNCSQQAFRRDCKASESDDEPSKLVAVQSEEVGRGRSQALFGPRPGPCRTDSARVALSARSDEQLLVCPWPQGASSCSARVQIVLASLQPPQKPIDQSSRNRHVNPPQSPTPCPPFRSHPFIPISISISVPLHSFASTSHIHSFDTNLSSTVLHISSTTTASRPTPNIRHHVRLRHATSACPHP